MKNKRNPDLIDDDFKKIEKQRKITNIFFNTGLKLIRAFYMTIILFSLAIIFLYFFGKNDIIILLQIIVVGVGILLILIAWIIKKYIWSVIK